MVDELTGSPYARVLIETLWNVKDVYSLNACSTCPCINRNIVECKDNTEEMARLISGRINRNIVECKVLICRICNCIRSGY